MIKESKEAKTLAIRKCERKDCDGVVCYIEEVGDYICDECGAIHDHLD